MKRTALARKTPLRGGDSSSLRKRSPLKAVNRERRSRRYQKDFAGDFPGLDKSDWIRSKPCVTSGSTHSVVAAHAKSRGAGGSAKHLVPLRYDLHEEQHRIGVRSFEERYGIDLMALAEEFEERWVSHVENLDPSVEIVTCGECDGKGWTTDPHVACGLCGGAGIRSFDSCP